MRRPINQAPTEAVPDLNPIRFMTSIFGVLGEEPGHLIRRPSRSPGIPTNARLTATATALLCTILLVPGGPADAQVDVSGEPAPLGCWRGQPLPDCRGFFLVEAQASLPLFSTTQTSIISNGSINERPAFESQLDWNLGYMVNLSERWALGGALTLGPASSDGLTGLKARARRWIARGVSLEFDAGALRTDGHGSFASEPLWGLTGDVRVNVEDRGSFFVRWDGVDVPGNQNPGGSRRLGGYQQAVYVGVGAGSTWAVVGTGVGFTVFSLLLDLAYSS